MRLFAFLALLPMLAVGRVEPVAGQRCSLLTIEWADGTKWWVLTETASEAEWIYYATQADRERVTKFSEKVNSEKWPKYMAGQMATVEGQTRGSYLVSLDDGRRGYVVDRLVGPTEEQFKLAQKQEVERKRVEAAKEAERKKAEAAVQARQEQARRKEAAYIASLPKLIGAGDKVMVATSADCAKDLQSIQDFGRSNGTGVAYRKKLIELTTLGCGVLWDRGTPLLVETRSSSAVRVRSYPGRELGFVLPENVTP